MGAGWYGCSRIGSAVKTRHEHPRNSGATFGKTLYSLKQTMASKPSRRIASAITLMFFLLLFGVDGCSRSRSNKTPGFAPIAGAYTGSGSHVETGLSGAPRLNVAWRADFTQQTESTFVGTMISRYTDPKTTVAGDSMQWGVKGVVTRSRFITIVETSMVIPKSPQWIWGDQQFLTSFDSCNSSVQGDTIYYRGPSPEFETFLLVRQH